MVQSPWQSWHHTKKITRRNSPAAESSTRQIDCCASRAEVDNVAAAAAVAAMPHHQVAIVIFTHVDFVHMLLPLLFPLVNDTQFC